MAVAVESLDHEARGITRDAGKVVFIEGALPNEIVSYTPLRNKRNFSLAKLARIEKESASRVSPRCTSFGICGGCSLQHLEPRAQVAVKQRVLEDALRHIGKLEAELILPAIHGPAWGYRSRARFSVRYVEKKGRALVGFHEKNSRYIADMASCPILPARGEGLLEPLKRLITALSIKHRVPQIELAIGEADPVIVIRILEGLNENDEAMIVSFAEQYGIEIYLQPRGPESARPFFPRTPRPLEYALPEFDLRMPFHPTEFTQVNHEVNRVLVRRAISLLDPQPGETIADLFCGVGNFSLAIARRGAQVLGIESSAALVRRAESNADLNGLGERADFVEADLFAELAALSKWGRFDGALIDPPRDGAIAVIKALEERAATLRRIVYVSCNPATLARDAAVLVHVKGYALKAAGVVNMFPHTSHVESIALFERA